MEERTNNTGLIDMPDLETSPVCKSIYDSLFASFQTAQDGNVDISLEVRLKNAAYNFARPISSNIAGGGGMAKDYLPLHGGSLSGSLSSLFSFKAGEEGKVLLTTFHKTVNQEIQEGIKITGLLDIDNDSIRIAGRSPFKYIVSPDGTTFTGMTIDVAGHANFGTSKISAGRLDIMDETLNSIFTVSPTEFKWNGKMIYHAGNSNKSDVDWVMKNSSILGTLAVSGASKFGDNIKALHGFSFGDSGTEILYSNDNQVKTNKSFSLQGDSSLNVDGKRVLGKLSTNHLQIDSIGGDLILGGDNTLKIRLWDSIYTENGDHELITKHGEASFMNKFKAGFDHGPTLLSTEKDCVIVHDQLRFSSSNGLFLKGHERGLDLRHTYIKSASEKIDLYKNTTFGLSTSLNTPLDRDSYSVFHDSNADYFVFNKPLEVHESIGISGSLTRLTKNSLLLTDTSYLLSISDGIKHFGNAYFVDSLSSERFSSGFSGEGWGIMKNLKTGNVTITIDEAVIRKKARIYELEIQKISTTNGSLWVSDACSGDTVTEIL